MTRSRSIAAAAAWLLFLPQVAAPAASAADVPETFYVDPRGNDAWSGRLASPNLDRTDGPKASLAGARDAVRALKAKGPLTDTVHIKIAGGLYVLAEPVTFTASDSGTPTFPVIYEACRANDPSSPAEVRSWAFKSVPTGCGGCASRTLRTANGISNNCS